jgi:hypothetical protein
LKNYFQTRRHLWAILNALDSTFILSNDIYNSIFADIISNHFKKIQNQAQLLSDLLIGGEISPCLSHLLQFLNKEVHKRINVTFPGQGLLITFDSISSQFGTFSQHLKK